MLKLNLVKGRFSLHLRPLKHWAAGVLALLLCGQVIYLWQKTGEAHGKRKEIELLSATLQTLTDRVRQLGPPERFEMIGGAVNARNEWLKARERAPVLLLEKLERERPGAVELRSFESDGTRGSVRMTVGDLDTASRYMNAVFGNRNVRTVMEERVANGIVAVCTWTE